MEARRQDVMRELRRIRDMPFGIARSEANLKVTESVEVDGPEEFLPWALFMLVQSYSFGHEPERAFVPFTKQIRLWDTRPELFDEYDRENFFWSFKWMVGHISDFPTIPLTQIENTLDDMERRYAEAGNGRSAVATLRFQHADALGTPDRHALFEEWARTPRDNFSQCEACEPGDMTVYLFAEGRTEEGIRLLEKTLANDPSCASEPGDMLSQLELAYLDMGRADDARKAHHRGLQHLDTSEHGGSLDGARGRHAIFLARSGNADAALRMIATLKDTLTGDGESPAHRFRVLARVGGAVNVLCQQGLGDRKPSVEIEGVSTLAEFNDWLRNQATGIAREFDIRNGTNGFSDSVDYYWSLTPSPCHVDLSVTTVTPKGARVVAEPSTGAIADPDVSAEGVADAPSTPEAFVVKAQSLASQDPAGAAAAWANASALFEDGGLLEAAGHAAGEAAQCAARIDAIADEANAWRRAEILTRAAGYTPLQTATFSRRQARSLAMLDDVEGAIEVVTSARDALQRYSSELSAEVQAATSGAATGTDTRSADERREAQAAAERLIQECSRADADLLDMLARLVASSGRHAEADALAIEAAEGFAALGAIGDASHAFRLAGQLRAENLGDRDGAIWAYESAVEGFGMIREVRWRSEAAGQLIELLRAAGRPEDADKLAESLSQRP